ncbi:MAG: DEAD/DEAH box helicase family protein [Dehalococcoidia bacterium]
MKSKIADWRNSNYKTEYPVISEILNYNYDSETQTWRYLRKAQFEALETYWYLRLIEKTPHIFGLYKKLFQPKELLNSLGITLTQEDLTDILLNGGGIDAIFEKIREDDEFVRKYRLEALRETLILSYPSYILALAMGAGKTILIGTIIATEFAMALEYPEDNFLKNALVFAPGKTILGALKELSDVPYENILPKRLYKQFITTVKFTYTRDGEKDIPIIKGSTFNIVVTNTEKIRIQKHSITKSLIRDLFVDPSREDEVKEAIANRRLQAIASLPNLAIFSDEAHHTYGLALGEELKRVRQTVNYLSEKTNVLVVVNTTGTPYYKRQMLKDVIYWYGLSQGIKDGILKEVRGNIVSYPQVTDKDFLKDIIADFFKNYKDVKIYDGSPSKLAIYFPQIEDLKNAKPFIEKILIELGLDPSVILEVHNESKQEVKDLFDNRINDPHLPYRMFLLVNKGTEGWNCLSLFSTALARKLTASNNFCLQAASRCLRQTPGNIHKAKIYLSKENVGILDAQLKETYGESLEDLNRTPQDMRKDRLILRKLEIPPVSLKKKIQKVLPKKPLLDISEIEFKKIEGEKERFKKTIHSLDEIPQRKGVLILVREEEIEITEDFVDTYTFAVELSSLYRLPLMLTYDKLKEFYAEGEIPESEAIELKRQIEGQVRNYEVKEEEVEVALALIRPEGFNKEEKDGKAIYVTEIVYHKDKEKYLLKWEEFKDKFKRNFGFHYNPYKFDSSPEKDFFIGLLGILNENPADIKDIYYTGGMDDPNKTEFLFEYKGKDGRYHNYAPDFLIRRKNGKVIIVEVKAERFKEEEKEKEMRRIEGLNPDRLRYELLETKGEQLTFENWSKVREAIYRYGAGKIGS